MNWNKFESIFKPAYFKENGEGRLYTFTKVQYLRHKCKLSEYKTIHRNANHVTILIPTE
jgi:hypothetical protein